MKREKVKPDDLAFPQWQDGNPQLLFRGPSKRLNAPYLAFVGGTETHGKFIEKPYPMLVEMALRQSCVNFGRVNGGVDVFVNDAATMGVCHKADLTIIQVMGANFLSNRYYSVDLRRNDRFFQASAMLQDIYSDVDFSEFSITRQMLAALHLKSPAQFETLVEELRAAWMSRMREMLSQIGERSILLWFSTDAMSDVSWAEHTDPFQVDPLFITASMIDALRPLVKDVVEVIPSEAAISQGTRGMFFPASQEKDALEMMGVGCHAEAAEILVPRIKEQLSVA